MNSQNNNENNKGTLSTIGKIRFWGAFVCGIVIGLIVMATMNPLAGFFILAGGVLFCPLYLNKLRALYVNLIIVLAIILVVIGGAMVAL
jgi:hypothetical protein